MRTPLCKLVRDRRGATAVEYGFTIALIVLAMIGGLRAVGSATIGLWQNTAAHISAAVA